MAFVKSKDIDDVLVAYFHDTTIRDEHQISQIGKELLDLESQATVKKKMVVNFQGVGFMSSAMLGQLVRLNNQAKADEVNLKFCCIADNVKQLFKLMHLKQMAYATEEKAIKSFSRKGWFG